MTRKRIPVTETTPTSSEENIPEGQNAALEPVPLLPVAESLDDRIAAAVAKSLGAALPKMAESMATAMATAMAVTRQQEAMEDHDKRLAVLRKKQLKEEKCHVCGQVVGDGRNYGCGGPWKRDPKTMAFAMLPVLDTNTNEPVLDDDGKPVMRRVEDISQFHIKRVVYPKDPIAVAAFDFVAVNNAFYKSQGPNHEIWVPRNMDIDAILSAMEQNEREQRVGRSHVRDHGGTISGKGQRSLSPIGAGFR